MKVSTIHSEKIEWERLTDKQEVFALVKEMGRTRKVDEFIKRAVEDDGLCYNYWYSPKLCRGLVIEIESIAGNWELLEAQVGSARSEHLPQLRQALKQTYLLNREPYRSNGTWIDFKPLKITVSGRKNLLGFGDQEKRKRLLGMGWRF